MTIQTVVDPSIYEQALLKIVRALPTKRIVQILDYARYVQAETQEDFGMLDEDDEDMVEFLLNHPYQVATFAPLTRDEIYKHR